jgi:hypothetical protein
LWLVLLPLSLLARYRSGRARGRARGWVVRGNAWLLLVSLPVFLTSSWVATRCATKGTEVINPAPPLWVFLLAGRWQTG